MMAVGFSAFGQTAPPTHKRVNGERVALTQSEIDEIKAEWVANEAEALTAENLRIARDVRNATSLTSFADVFDLTDEQRDYLINDPIIGEIFIEVMRKVRTRMQAMNARITALENP